jgi:3-oxoacyl-[acyl-carrier protein] reductase
VLDANLRVKVRDDNEDNMRPKGDDEIKIENLDDKKIALVTGANGSLGCSIAMTLARNGWNLLLQYRNETKKLEEIKSIVLGLGRECTRIKADLSTEKGVAAVARKASRDRNLMALIHTASPQLNDTLESMMSVNFSALVTITKAILPSMLRQQRGCVLQIGSSALQFVPPGLENYIAAKSAAAVFTDSIGIRFKEYGISGITVAPGYVDTPYSNSIRSVGKALLIKEEVADVVADAVNSVQVGSADASSYIWIEPGSLKKGRFGFYQMERSSVKSTSEISKENQDDKIRVENRDPGVVRKQLRDLMVDLFKLPEETSADQIVIGSTPGWDSLRQIELILAVEKAFRIKFTSNEFILGSSLNELEKLIESKLFDQNFT